MMETSDTMFREEEGYYKGEIHKRSHEVLARQETYCDKWFITKAEAAQYRVLSWL